MSVGPKTFTKDGETRKTKKLYVFFCDHREIKRELPTGNTAKG